MVHISFKPDLENFEHYFASVWGECNSAVVWAFFGIAFLWDSNENWPFPVLWLLLSFPNLLAYWVQHFHSIIFDIWNSSTGMPTPPLSSAQFSRSVVSNSLQPREPQHTRPPSPSPTAGVYPNPCPLSRWCHPTISSSVIPFSFLQSFPASGSFQNESALCIRWPNCWNYSFNISPSNEHPGLISFRMDWSDLLAVRGNLKSLLQRHSSKASILWHSAFFIVQLLHPYMTTGKTIALTRQILLAK